MRKSSNFIFLRYESHYSCVIDYYIRREVSWKRRIFPDKAINLMDKKDFFIIVGKVLKCFKLYSYMYMWLRLDVPNFFVDLLCSTHSDAWVNWETLVLHARTAINMKADSPDNLLLDESITPLPPIRYSHCVLLSLWRTKYRKLFPLSPREILSPTE